jgi:hypothetical protein
MPSSNGRVCFAASIVGPIPLAWSESDGATGLPALHPLTDATTKPSRAVVTAIRDRWLIGSSPGR